MNGGGSDHTATHQTVMKHINVNTHLQGLMVVVNESVKQTVMQ